MDNTNFFHNKPLFGLDIGYSSAKILQMGSVHHKQQVIGYGVTSFQPKTIDNGIVKDHESVAKNIYQLMKHHIIGDITTRRVAMSIPASRTFNRTVTLPTMKNKTDFMDAIKLEAEQYIPIPIDDLYIDYEVISQDSKQTELFATAVPKKLVDSYMDLANILGLEVVAMETTINAAARLFVQAEQNDDIPTILIDFGSMSSDITIYDGTLIVTGTIPSGGDSFSHLIAEKLGVTLQEAHIIKTKYGLGVSKNKKR
jgi:type IV pilus assembly protein PilM